MKIQEKNIRFMDAKKGMIHHLTMSAKILRGSREMTVNMGTKTYEMSRKQAKAILGTAKKLADCNIYGIEKGNVVIMLNEKYEDDMSLKKAVEEYKKKGFKVHWK